MSSERFADSTHIWVPINVKNQVTLLRRVIILHVYFSCVTSPMLEKLQLLR